MTLYSWERKYIPDLVQDIIALTSYADQDTTISGIIATEWDYTGTSGIPLSADILDWRNSNYADVYARAQTTLGKIAVYDDYPGHNITSESIALYDLTDGLIDNDGITYDLLNTGYTITLEYPVDFQTRRAAIYTQDITDVYISTSSNGTDYTYWSTDGSHDITSGGLLIEGIDETTASGNYWSLNVGTNTAQFPTKTTGRFCRLHLVPTVSGSHLLWQIDFQNLSIATSVLAGPQGWTESNYLMLGTIGVQEEYTYDTGSDAGAYWTNDANAIDGNEVTYAYRDTATVAKETTKWFKGTAHDYTTASGEINTVEVGVLSSATTTVGKGATTHYMVPIFLGASDGDEHNRINVPTTGIWYWWDITNDTNAPSTWGWSDIAGVDAKVYVAQAANPNPSWYGTWAKRIKITIDKDQFDSSLTWFPLMVELGTSVGQSSQDVSSVFDEISDSQYKIQFTDANQNPLHCEVEWWDGVGEYAVMWVSKTGWSISNSSDTTIYLYYDSSKANNTTYVHADGDGNLIFDDDYEAVYHLNSGLDSKYSDDLSTAVTDTPLAKIGYGYDFEATNSDIADANGYPITAAITVQAWRKDESHVDSNVVVSKHGSDTTTVVADTLYRLYTSGSNMAFSLRGTFSDIDLSAGAISNGTWYMQTGTWSNSTGDAKLYSNGTSVASTSGKYGAINTFTSDMTLGAAKEGSGGTPDESNYYDGVMDEVRISSVERSAAWVEADYQTGSDNTNTFTTEELYTAQTDAQHRIHGMKVKVNYTQTISEDKYIFTTDLII